MIVSEPVIRMENIIKRYYIGKPNELQILNGISLSVDQGEFVSIVGESGSGKSTLMNIIGVLDRQTEGTYFLEGKDVNKMDDSMRSAIRNKRIGFVFQNFNLFPHYTVMKNIIDAPIHVDKVSRTEAVARAEKLLAQLGLSDKADAYPYQLSGGQQQRCAIARALIKNPKLLLCDEPTGALDSRTSRDILILLEKINAQYGTTMIIVTHNNAIKDMVDQVIVLKDGQIKKNYNNETKVPAAELEDL